jgi:RNA ligase (TIGR02306 family)
MRKLASIRRIDELNPIEGADKIEVATVGGWKVVCQKGLYNVGDLAVYFEIDSWIPSAVAPFLTKDGHFPKVFEGVEGERLKTIRLRGQLSQGLLMPIHNDKTGTYLMVYTDETGEYSLTVAEGDDVSEPLGILKWEKAIPAQLAGISRGNFPTLIPKTDQERVQNLKKEIAAAQGQVYEVTEKLEGSSMTCYVIDGEFGVCSRNLNLKETEGNSFWNAARDNDLEQKMLARQYDFAIQGELIGPGVQGNIYKLTKPEFYVFDIYDVKDGEYMNPAARRQLVESLGLKHVPILDDMYVLNDDVEQLLTLAEGKSRMFDTEREGIVFKQNDGGMTFKAISNKYLLNEK